MTYADADRAIAIRGARQNNLKNLDLDIPCGRFTVVTGVSGSGKSSLAFDTLYAEGQRRYVETFSPYARQFMDRMDRPQVERIEGIPPAIAIDRKDPVRTSRSTVGTMTEITDYVKLLFARLGQLHCRQCGRPVAATAPAEIWNRLKGLERGTEVVITFPFRPESGAEPPDGTQHPLGALQVLGYDRWYRDGKVRDLSRGNAFLGCGDGCRIGRQGRCGQQLPVHGCRLGICGPTAITSHSNKRRKIHYG